METKQTEKPAVKIVIDSTTYVVPKEVTYRQYKEAGTLIKGIELPQPTVDTTEEDGQARVGIDMQEVFIQLLEADVIPEMLAILLVPEGEKWKPDYKKNKELFVDLGDETILEIFADFLLGRASLMASIMTYLSPLLAGKAGSLSK